MSIERLDDQVELICDGCGAGLGTAYEGDEFDIMVDNAKSRGWKIRKEGATWKHYCADCRPSGR